jgi:GntR family transcriptional regulator/MocR family aminotransferase
MLRGPLTADPKRPLVEIPPILLDRSASAPLAVQVADALRAMTAGGGLRRGDRLPSTRALATTLGVSRTVTATAYDQLLAEGWVAGRRGAGTFVVAVPAPTPAPRPAADPRHRRPRLVDLRAGLPCRDVIDPAAWRRAWRVAADDPPDVEPDPVGVPAFRAAVAEHLLRHRGLAAAPDAVLATAGSTATVAELVRTLPAGVRVAVENPGYRRAVGALQAAGAAVVPVPVDGEGLVVDALPAGLAAVVVTPAHQYPLGARLSAARRVALVARARAEGLLVVEDDYDGELRYDVAPLPLLAALGPDVVAHLGTASKLLTPTLGVGWLVAPPAVRAAVLDLRERTATRPARAGQRVFAALAAHGDLGRHLRRLRRELASRRREVLDAVRAGGREVCGEAAGAHVVVPLPGPDDEQAVIAAAAERGVGLDGLAPHHVPADETAGAPRPGAVSGVVLGYAGPPLGELEGALAVVTAVLRAR